LVSLLEDGDLGPVTDVLDPADGVVEARWGELDESFFYRRTLDGVTNICHGPVRGKMTHAVTTFESGVITSFDPSPDFKQLAIARGEAVGDVVMLSDFRN
jgi:hypothetical protein